ncbi:uncharacterized protein LOC143226293 [Tachypleus tridentatus]|uniref:uncharacterized protein LOC143226293 n=1 Tax=Tachypleus tridentatus TaxID=6853 RepID=UPI003FD5B573
MWNYKYWKEELSFQSSENTLLMTFHFGGNFLFGEIDFTLTFTGCFYRGHRSTCGNSNNFQCDNLCCIYDGLTCDGHNNCGDSSDESHFGNSDCRSPTAGAVIGIVLAVVIAVIAMFVTVVIYRRKRKVTVSYIRTPTRFTAPPPYVTSSSPCTSENPPCGTLPPPYTSVNSAYPYNSNMRHDNYTNHQIPPRYEVQTSNVAISNPIY